MTSYSSTNILSELQKRYNKNTPDFLDRKMDNEIPVFVYGTLKYGHHNHGVLGDAKYLGSATTCIDKFEVREPTHGYFPIVHEVGMQSKTNLSAGKVRGECYVVDPLTLLELDRLEDNGFMYTRSLQWVYLSDQAVKGNSFKPSVQAWMYIAERKYWDGKYTIKYPSTMNNKTRYYDWTDIPFGRNDTGKTMLI